MRRVNKLTAKKLYSYKRRVTTLGTMESIQDFEACHYTHCCVTTLSIVGPQ